MWGASSNPGPNAPFSMPCSSQQPGVDMVSAIETWTKAGMPKSKIVMGLAAYGYINWSTKTSLVHRKRSFSSRSAHARRGRQHTRSVEAEPTLGELMSGVKVKRQQTRFERYLESAEKRRALRSGATLDHLVHSRAKRQNSCPNPDVDCQGVNNVLPPVANDTVIGSPATTTTTTTAAGNGLGIGQIGNIKATGNGNLASYPDSQIEFADIIGWGVLTSSFKGANGYTVAWDSCSSTVRPFLFLPLSTVPDRSRVAAVCVQPAPEDGRDVRRPEVDRDQIGLRPHVRHPRRRLLGDDGRLRLGVDRRGEVKHRGLLKRLPHPLPVLNGRGKVERGTVRSFAAGRIPHRRLSPSLGHALVNMQW